MIHSGGCSGMEPRSALKKAVSMINQAITLNYALEEKVDLGSVEEFSQMLARRLSIISTNFEVPDFVNKSDYYKKMNFSKKEINEYNLKEYIDKPMFMTADGILFIIEKFKPGCEFVDEENPNNSDCIIVIDTNGYKIPNLMTTDAKVPRDRYKIFVYGNENKAVPLIIEHQSIMSGRTVEELIELQKEKNGREQ